MGIFFKILKGLNGQWYAVFETGVDAERLDWLFYDCRIVCFDGYENAYLLEDFYLS